MAYYRQNGILKPLVLPLFRYEDAIFECPDLECDKEIAIFQAERIINRRLQSDTYMAQHLHRKVNIILTQYQVIIISTEQDYARLLKRDIDVSENHCAVTSRYFLRDLIKVSSAKKDNTRYTLHFY